MNVQRFHNRFFHSIRVRIPWRLPNLLNYKQKYCVPFITDTVKVDEFQFVSVERADIKIFRLRKHRAATAKGCFHYMLRDFSAQF